MLVEEGFQVVSTDASDKMLKYALRQRWKRRREPAFDKWSKHAGCFFSDFKNGKNISGQGRIQGEPRDHNSPKDDEVALWSTALVDSLIVKLLQQTFSA